MRYKSCALETIIHKLTYITVKLVVFPMQHQLQCVTSVTTFAEHRKYHAIVLLLKSMYRADQRFLENHMLNLALGVTFNNNNRVANEITHPQLRYFSLNFRIVHLIQRGVSEKKTVLLLHNLVIFGFVSASDNLLRALITGQRINATRIQGDIGYGAIDNRWKLVGLLYVDGLSCLSLAASAAFAVAFISL